MCSILSITREMLSAGIFNHLHDDEISKLHYLIVSVADSKTNTQINQLISYWYKGNFDFTSDALRLLQQCNEFLQRVCRPLIENYSEEFSAI